jgi:hypothetical protein
MARPCSGEPASPKSLVEIIFVTWRIHCLFEYASRKKTGGMRGTELMWIPPPERFAAGKIAVQHDFPA